MLKTVRIVRILVVIVVVAVCTRAQTTTTPGTYFGMHETDSAVNGWPSVAFGTYRAWNAYPLVGWADINTSPGVYNWTNLDNLVSLSRSHGVDVLYTFGRTPTWASSNPTGYCKYNPPGSCYPPASQQDWKNFVAAITTRYAGQIKYWEMWNEPNAINLWAGTTEQMVTMAQNAYPIITASSSAAVVLSPAPQGTSAYKWMAEYLAAGATPYADAIAFHGYLASTNGVSNPPEGIVALVRNMKSVMGQYGIESKPLWDTEHSWGANTDLPDQNQQSAWLARHVILSWSNGVARSIWYLWDSPNIGTLWDKTSGIHKPGVAYGQVYKWLVGATLNTPCSIGSNYTWTCVLTTSTGEPEEVIWNSVTSVSETVPGQYSQYRDLSGNVYAVPSTQSIMAGANPLLLQTGGSTDAPPLAVLSVTPLSGSVPFTVTANSSGSSDPDGSIVSRTISFGDGTVVNGPSASHTYNSTGSFTVTLTVKDESGLMGTASQAVTVKPTVTVLLTNPGFELGTAGWAANALNGGSINVVTNPTLAHSGSRFEQATSGTNEYVALFAADAYGHPKYFPVKPGQVVTFGGWVYRVSGDGYARWKIQVSDSSKANITHVSPVPSTVTTMGKWVWMEQSYTVPTGKAYVRFELDVYRSTVPTVVRFDDSLLQIK